MQNNEQPAAERIESDGTSRLPSKPRPNTSRGERKPRAWLRIVVVLAVILSPIIIYLLYELTQTAPLKQRIIVATSQPGGRHFQTTTSLADALRRDGLDVKDVETLGSYHNLFLLQSGLVDFVLYQSGTSRLLSDSVLEGWDSAGNQDGRLTMDEILRDQKRNEGNQANEEQVEAIFARLDEDPKDNCLTKQEFANTSMIRCVATLYPEVVHFVVRKDSRINEPKDLRRKVVALGQPRSGSYAMSKLLLSHYGIAESEVSRFENESLVIGTRDAPGAYYARIEEAFRAAQLDAALITMGLHGERVDDLLGDETLQLELLGMPAAEGITTKNVMVMPYRIPPGTYSHQRDNQQGLSTIAVKAQLLTRKGVSDEVVRKVAETVMTQQFLIDNNLRDLASQSYESRVRVAQETLEFKLHRAANNFYNPDAFDPEEFQNWEAFYSLIASLAIGLFVASRWIVRRKERQAERTHDNEVRDQKDRLDEFLARTMAVERAQINMTDMEQLGRCLDDVTRIKLEALDNLTDEDLRSDRTFSIFLMQCANLINKIQLKIIAYAANPESKRSVTKRHE